jgi:hypothetical protein
MSDEMRWDRDPPRDEALARLLRAGDAAIPYRAVNWARLSDEVMRRARAGTAGGLWWECIAGWGRIAAAASIAAILVSGLLLWRTITSMPPAESVAAVPESVAIARVATSYPVEPTFASLVQTEHHDEFTTWGAR